MSWHDCQAFVARLNAKVTREGFRLPTEAEWEYACRAGATTEFHFGNAREQLSAYAWSSGGRPRPVGSLKPSRWGLHDMTGNVFEWCQDRGGRYGEGAQTDPTGPTGAGKRIVRGGAFCRDAYFCRSAARYDFPEDKAVNFVGLRIARTFQPREGPPVPVPPKPDGEARRQDDERRQLDARCAQELAAIDARVVAWDFAGASAALGRLTPGGKALAERFTRRRDEVGRMAALKAKMIARINTAKPKLRKSTLGIKGINADLAKADEQGITTAKLATGKTETFAWTDLDADAVRRLASYTARTADDHLAAGILLLTLDDAVGAETAFAKAKAGGLAIERYLDPLAAAAFARAKALLDKGDLPKAAAALAELDGAYAKTPWLAAHKAEVEAARRRAAGGLTEAAAEKLYAMAARLYGKQDLWALKPVIDKLKADYAKAALVADAARKPTFAEMAAAVAKLGKFITVRKDGKGDFKTIGGAVAAAVPNSTIEIQDSAKYREHVTIPPECVGLTLRGASGCWPVMQPEDPKSPSDGRLHVRATRTVVERIVIANDAPLRPGYSAFAAMHDGSIQLRAVVAYAAPGLVISAGSKAEVSLERCILIGGTQVHAPAKVAATECIWHGPISGWSNTPLIATCTMRDVVLTGGTGVKVSGEFRHCTILNLLRLSGETGVVSDCIVESVSSAKRETRIDHCDVFGGTPFAASAKAGTRCFSRDPQFRDADSLDFRLKPTSPCRKRASDGGDMGCRYTPEMLEMLKLAHELRKKGIIKF